jgi:hypothetical protein
MSDNKIVVPGQQGNPFMKAQSEHLAVGTIAIEAERAIAEAQGKLVIAKRFPRDENAAFERVMKSCARPSLAAQAFYSFPRGKEVVSGISIRLAEELARAWGNIDYGIRELSQKPGESEMEAYCWDLQTNTFSSQKFTVKHERHTRHGVTTLKDPRDIYELTANQGARRLRARILAVLPPDLIDAAEDACRAALSAPTAKSREDVLSGLVGAFSKYGVSEQMIVDRYGVAIADLTDEYLDELRGIYHSIKDNMSGASEWFSPSVAESETIAKLNLSVAKAAPADDDEPVE